MELALLQWTLYYGQYLTVAFWAGLVGCCCGSRCGAQHKGDGHVATGREQIGALFRSLGLPAAGLATVTLIVYLAFVPRYLSKTEERFQQQMAFARQPDEHWRKVEQAVQQVRSDAATMAALRESVRADMLKETQEEVEQ